MYGYKHLCELFKSARRLTFNDYSKIVIMSDCHRGDASWADTFYKNKNIYITALKNYYNNNYTYIELGDGDELWENDKLSDIVYAHKDVYWILSQFHKKGRLHLLYGNHDMIKKNKDFVKNHMNYYYDNRIKRYIPLFKDIDVHEALVLKHRNTGYEIFLVHGHQVDFMDDKLWKFRRLLVRYLWRPLEVWGIKDPTGAAKNYDKSESIGKELSEWVDNEKQMMIAGHTHRSVFPEVGDTPYFNDGSCVHPRCITAIEITGGFITLVKWEVKTSEEGTLFIDREVIAEPERLSSYFESSFKSKEKRIQYID